MQVVVGVIAVVAVILGFTAMQNSRGIKADIERALADQSQATSDLQSQFGQIRQQTAQNTSGLSVLNQELQTLKDQMTKKPVVDTSKSSKGTNDPANVNAPTGPGTYHTIKAGDMLGRIAKQYNTSVEAVEKLNPGLSAKHLKVGKKIRVK